MLHLSGGRHTWGRAGHRAGSGINNGYGVARSLSHGLVKLHGMLLLLLGSTMLLVGIVVVVCGCREEEGGGRLDLLLERRCFR